jgi:hypothetical protein
MKVGLIKVDGKFPNLALMKLSAFHKKQGDDITIIDLSTFEFDKLYGSQIFMGGSGYDLVAKLPEEIEHIRPDYDLFNKDFSMGFTSRGCIRDCKFCIVRAKEGFIKEHAQFGEFVDDRFNKVLIMDSNFMASPKCIGKLKTIIAKKWKVCFTQGIDVRLMTEEKAALLSRVKYYSWKFSERRLYIAWDHVENSEEILKGIGIMLGHIPAIHVMCYVLVGFDTDHTQDMFRIQRLIDLGIKPFVMIYNNRRDNPTIRHLARWVNQRFYEFVTWEDYLKKKAKT